MKRKAGAMTALYVILQWTWGFPQTLAGLIVCALHRREHHWRYHGAVVTQWTGRSSVSLGQFVFVTARPYFAQRFQGSISEEELAARLLVHEYGHTIQSLLLGPLYLPVIGVASTVWGFSPRLNRMRWEKQVSYFAFFTERWANALGERATGERSMEQLVIDQGLYFHCTFPRRYLTRIGDCTTITPATFNCSDQDHALEVFRFQRDGGRCKPSAVLKGYPLRAAR